MSAGYQQNRGSIRASARRFRLPKWGKSPRRHHFFTPTYSGLGERAHLASPSNDLETHIQDLLGALKFEDLRNVVLIAHSYGGMVATGVADQARDRVARLIYLNAFVPTSGQALIDLVPPAERQRLLDSVKTGDGWRGHT